MLNDDILLSVFNYYRLDDENSWNDRLGWCQLSHVCRRWRHLVYSSAFYLGMHIRCTNGNHIVDKLDHLPPIPIFINYRRYATALTWKDEFGIYHTLRLRDRVLGIALRLPPSTLHKFLMLMDEPFPILEKLSLSFKDDGITSLILPMTFMAPNLRHLSLRGVGLPIGISSLSSTVSLVTVALTNIRASGYFLPGELVACLESLPQLKELSIEFSVPIPRPSAERELLGEQATPGVTLPNLKSLTFQGVSAYLDCLVAQIRAPFLERLNITLFRQIAFTLPHLNHFTNITEKLKLTVVTVSFWRDAISIASGTHMYAGSGPFLLRVMCKQLDWQIDCATQICSALIPALSCVERLTLDRDEEMPTEWMNGGIDGTTWHELLRPFIGVKELRICDSLSKELSRALEVDEIGSDPGLLPCLQELASKFMGADGLLFGSFIHARGVAGRPVRSSFPSTRHRIAPAPYRVPVLIISSDEE